MQSSSTDLSTPLLCVRIFLSIAGVAIFIAKLLPLIVCEASGGILAWGTGAMYVVIGSAMLLSLLVFVVMALIVYIRARACDVASTAPADEKVLKKLSWFVCVPLVSSHSRLSSLLFF